MYNKLTPFLYELQNVIKERNIDIKDAISYAKDENLRNKELVEFLNSIK